MVSVTVTVSVTGGIVVVSVTVTVSVTGGRVSVSVTVTGGRVVVSVEVTGGLVTVFVTVIVTVGQGTHTCVGLGTDPGVAIIALLPARIITSKQPRKTINSLFFI